MKLDSDPREHQVNGQKRYEVMRVLLLSLFLLSGDSVTATGSNRGWQWVPYEPTCAPSADVPIAGTLPRGTYNNGRTISERTETRPQTGSWCDQAGGVMVGGGEWERIEK